MFQDGQWYAAISRNLADGDGTWWKPISGWLPDHRGFDWFYGHPPLAIWMESLCFTLLGDSLYVERAYSLLLGIITALLIALAWRQIFKGTPLSAFAWLPVLFWILMPVTSWSIQNNVLENTMTVFILMAAIACIGAVRTSGFRSWPLLIASAILIFLATLAKGPVGLFPLAIPVLWSLAHRWHQWLLNGLRCVVLSVLVALGYLLLTVDPSARESLLVYWQEQVVFSIKNDSTVGSRFYLLYEWLLQNIIPALTAGVMMLAGWRLKTERATIRRNYVAFFFLFAACGTLPLLISMKQRWFYLSPALPFAAIGFAVICAPAASVILESAYSRMRWRGLNLVTLLLIMGSIAFSIASIGGVKKDSDMLHDIHVIGPVVATDSIVSVSPGIRWQQWGFQAYLMRYYNVSVDVAESNRRFLITDRASQWAVPDDYFTVPTDSLYRYRLFGRETGEEIAR